MGSIGKALGYSLDLGDEEGDDESPASEPKEPKAKVPTAEVLAMKQFERAKSPEEKAQALKDFLSACGVYDSD